MKSCDDNFDKVLYTEDKDVYSVPQHLIEIDFGNGSIKTRVDSGAKISVLHFKLIGEDILKHSSGMVNLYNQHLGRVSKLNWLMCQSV